MFPRQHWMLLLGSEVHSWQNGIIFVLFRSRSLVESASVSALFGTLKRTVETLSERKYMRISTIARDSLGKTFTLPQNHAWFCLKLNVPPTVGLASVRTIFNYYLLSSAQITPRSTELSEDHVRYQDLLQISFSLSFCLSARSVYVNSSIESEVNHQL